MSKRIEEKAIDAWAIYEYREHPKGLYHTCFVDGYKEGYEQAERDNALTAEDCSIVMDAFFDYMGDISAGRASAQNTKEGLYMEVLCRYKELNAIKEK